MPLTLEQLEARLPEALRPWARQYGPALLAMTAEEIRAWIDLLIRGRVLEAYQAVLDKMPAGELLAEWNALAAQWDAANDRNAARLELQRAAAATALKILLAVAVAAVGL